MSVYNTVSAREAGAFSAMPGQRRVSGFPWAWLALAPPLCSRKQCVAFLRKDFNCASKEVTGPRLSGAQAFMAWA